jgi:hypothetical protein
MVIMKKVAFETFHVGEARNTLGNEKRRWRATSQ